MKKENEDDKRNLISKLEHLSPQDIRILLYGADILAMRNESEKEQLQRA